MLALRQYQKVNRKQPSPGFELGSLIPFLMTILPLMYNIAYKYLNKHNLF